MASVLKVDELETINGSGNITVNNSITMASAKTLPAASLTGTLPALDGSALTSIGGVSTLGALSSVTISTTYPTISTNPSAVGHLWIDKVKGEMYVCTDATTGANAWINVGKGTGHIT